VNEVSSSTPGGFVKVLRTATTIAVCLWLILPSTHALALCIDSDGSLALEVAIDGACTGSRGGAKERGGAAARGLGPAADSLDCCGGCTDVVLGGDGTAIPAKSLSGTPKLTHPVEKAADATDAPRISQPRTCGGTRFGPFAPISGRSPTRDSVVLRL
jgi:hypothetical protein